SPALIVSKALTGQSADPIVEGTQLTYTITASNSGNVALTNVVVSDPLLTPASEICASVAVAGSCVLTGSYTVTAADVTAGSISNTGTADSDQTDPLEDTVVTPVEGSPALLLVKTAGEPAGSAAGDTIPYTFEVTNTGNVTITDLVINDEQLDDPAVCEQTTLAPGASTICTGVHSITVEEVDAGQVDNTATGEGVDPGNQAVISPSSSTSTPLGDVTPPVNPEVSVAKASDPASGSEVSSGQTIVYTLTAEVSEANLTADLVLEDMLGTGLTFGSVSNAGAFIADTTNAPALTFTLPSDTAPGSYELVYTATVDADASAAVGNSVVVMADGGDPDPECPSCETSHPIATPPIEPPSTPIAVNSLSRTGMLLLMMLALIAGFSGIAWRRV
ncbi:MAG: hypothetical protein RQ741_10745, partial [Wenzhouxiangellaceae bacterium]|nr:hypothetical protein [Wenzhouxiangellaceae bacterium]